MSQPSNPDSHDGFGSRARAWLLGWWPLVKQTVADWWEDKAPRLGASLAFYTVLSLAPLLVLVTPMLGLVLQNPDAARKGISHQFEQLVGPEGAAAIDAMLKDPGSPVGKVVEEAAAATE